MNKYQEALDRLIGITHNFPFKEWQKNDNKEMKDLLQELVDKETPKKVKHIMNNVIYGDHHSTGYCPNCNTYLDIPSDVWYHVLAETDYFSCGCGQKLDWSEDD